MHPHMTHGFFFPLFWESVGECWILVVPNVFPSSPQWVHNMFPITPHYIPYPLPYTLVGQYNYPKEEIATYI
jgi:hypothetical protein